MMPINILQYTCGTITILAPDPLGVEDDPEYERYLENWKLMHKDEITMVVKQAEHSYNNYT